MSNTIPEGYQYEVVVPAGHEGLTFRYLKPDDFKVMPIEPSQPDFEKSPSFMALHVAATQYGPMVLSVGARPAFGDGTVVQWLEYLCREEGYQPVSIDEGRIGIHPAMICDVLQRADEVVMKSRLGFFEDGGRFFQVGVTAPEPFWNAAMNKFTPMLESFELREARGSAVPLRPGEPSPAEAAAAAAARVEIRTDKPAEPDATGSGAGPEQSAGVTAPAEAPRARMNDAEIFKMALAEDPSTFSQEHPVNANLLNRGIGFVPRIAKLESERRYAWLGAGALEGFIRVPFGWHVIDDGKRTLVFDGGNAIQVNLSLRRSDGIEPADFAEGCIQQYLTEQPDLQTIRAQIEDIAGAGVRGLNIEGEILDQYFLVRDVGRPGLLLVARATSSAEDAVRALDLAGDLLATFGLQTDG